VIRRLVVVASALVLMATADPASAAWAVNGSGPARAQAVEVPQGATPSAVKVTDSAKYGTIMPVFVVSWDTARLPGGRAVTGYQVRRTIYPGTWMAKSEVIQGTCLGTAVQGHANVYLPATPTAPKQSCTDTEAFAKGDVSYSVTPVLSSWVGPTSAASAIYR
jgi:hypothetical protein